VQVRGGDGRNDDDNRWRRHRTSTCRGILWISLIPEHEELSMGGYDSKGTPQIRSRSHSSPPLASRRSRKTAWNKGQHHARIPRVCRSSAEGSERALVVHGQPPHYWRSSHILTQMSRPPHGALTTSGDTFGDTEPCWVADTEPVPRARSLQKMFG